MKIIYVDRTAVDANLHYDAKLPVLTMRDEKERPHCGNRIVLKDGERVVGVFRYEPEGRLKWGPRIWFETDLEVEVE